MDREDQETLEESRAAVDMWIDKIANDRIVGDMETPLLRSVLESYGANFDITEEEQQSLRAAWNVGRRKGMNAVWGEENVKEYRIWLRHWLEDYEKRTGDRLPVIKGGTVNGNDTKSSGGLKFFTDLTVFAAGLMEPNDYRTVTEIRAKRGMEWKKRDPKKKWVKISTSSFPPGFPHEAWQKIKTLVG